MMKSSVALIPGSKWFSVISFAYFVCDGVCGFGIFLSIAVQCHAS